MSGQVRGPTEQRQEKLLLCERLPGPKAGRRPGNSCMSCANTGAASVAVTMMKQVVSGHAALKGATFTAANPRDMA